MQNSFLLYSIAVSIVVLFCYSEFYFLILFLGCSWFYRIKPSVTHEPFKPRVPSNGKILSEFNNSNSCANPTQLRWKPMDIHEDSHTDFVDGLSTICGSGSSFTRHGYAIHM